MTEMLANIGKFVRSITGAKFHFADPVDVSSSGNTVLVLDNGGSGAPGSIPEVNEWTGELVRVISGLSFAFSDALALAVSGRDVFVADESSDTVTEANVSNSAIVRVVQEQRLDAPDGIAVSNGNVWVADSVSNSATVIDAVSGEVVGTDGDSDGDYGFGQLSQVIAAQGNVYMMAPFGTSPMVTKVAAMSGTPARYMSDTNGPH